MGKHGFDDELLHTSVTVPDCYSKAPSFYMQSSIGKNELALPSDFYFQLGALKSGSNYYLLKP